MALVHSFEKSGNFLFRYRGQIPTILFLLAIPVVYFTNYDCLQKEGWYFTALLVVSVVLSLLGQIIRAIAIGTSNKNTSGRNTKKQVAEALNTKGIYSTMRHPLYVGNYFMWIGIVAYTGNIWFVVLVSLAFWLYYERIMFAEERFLERKFGEDYVNWSLKVPAFIPSFKNYEENDIKFSMKTILRREYSGVTATMLGFLFVDFFRDWFTTGKIEFRLYYVVVLVVALSISLILRTLKHHTKVLHEADRS
ncbi:lipid A phosphate methyltransferase [Lishizhenia tianjinensis]|uniref:Lipid A phosphate methyltransferase n=1 Tax=Lishizhenia tianjinensis TaxID=477690 RepID=A0A1I6YX58_9FLAO|nr:isoprenylcysteine carboxylmethyltransferase family protein [Lishizhenia tianjinensis]SFT55055.1 lipid A phosphate methyltransferase [Lishizhenia tianjinensis]